MLVIQRRHNPIVELQQTGSLITQVTLLQHLMSVLLQVGAFMVAAVADIEWTDVRQAVPAFVTILVM